MAIALHEMLESLFGIKSFPRENPYLVPHVANIATQQFLPYNPQRVSFVVTNLSANVIYIAPSNLVATDRGIRLAPQGGSAALTWDRDFELCSHDWYCTATVDASDFYVLENVAQ